MKTTQQVIKDEILDLQIKKALVERFDQEKAELLDSVIYELKKILNEKTKTERGEGNGYSLNIIREIKE
jgi:hypothetical protein